MRYHERRFFPFETDDGWGKKYLCLVEMTGVSQKRGGLKNIGHIFYTLNERFAEVLNNLNGATSGEVKMHPFFAIFCRRQKNIPESDQIIFVFETFLYYFCNMLFWNIFIISSP